jgi:hypothetical protein
MRVGPSGCAALQLLACCPRVPTDVVATLLRMQHTRSAAQLLLRLRTTGLARFETAKPGPLVGSRRVRLWTLTHDGRTFLETRGLARSEEAVDGLPYGRPARWPETARQRDTPMLITAYRMLAEVAAGIDHPLRMVAWEHPWTRTLAHPESGRARRVQLPASVRLMPSNASREQPRGLLLVPDLGTRPVASYRPVLHRLIELRQVTDVDEADEPLVVVGVTVAHGQAARVAAWQSLLEQVTRRAGERPLHARVVVHPEALATDRTPHRQHGAQADQALGLVARHPLIERRQLAALLGTSPARAGQLVRQLSASGWVRAREYADAPPEPVGVPPRRPHPLSLVELTSAGRREVARRLLLPATAATRHHGLLGNHASSRRFWRHLAHTIGANEVFVAFVLATARGGDEALEEWRSAAACARGRFRPDGYGCYRRGRSRFGFFVEFDRGTEKAARVCREARRVLPLSRCRPGCSRLQRLSHAAGRPWRKSVMA